MTGRPLGPDEQALWARVTAGVRPLRRATPVIATVPLASSRSQPPAAPGEVADRAPRQPRTGQLPVKAPADTLDASWDKRLRRGTASPDRTLDLHGLTQPAAHAALEAALGDALADGVRLLLLVTGRPPRPGLERPHARGAIRAAVPDWLAGSRHAGRIAAVRPAHPRHGGGGALYLVLRRTRARAG